MIESHDSEARAKIAMSSRAKQVTAIYGIVIESGVNKFFLIYSMVNTADSHIRIRALSVCRCYAVALCFISWRRQQTKIAKKTSLISVAFAAQTEAIFDHHVCTQHCRIDCVCVCVRGTRMNGIEWEIEANWLASFVHMFSYGGQHTTVSVEPIFVGSKLINYAIHCMAITIKQQYTQHAIEYTLTLNEYVSV